MKNQPRFSVIITTYNRRDYVLQAIESVRRQTYRAHEIIVVVDGSTDDTVERVRHEYSDEKLGEKSNVIVLEQENTGRAIAANAGIALATGDWVGFLDDDDLWHRDKLRLTVEYLADNPDCRAVNNPIWFFAESEQGARRYGGFARDLVAKNLDECQQLADSGTLPNAPFDYLLIKGDSYRKLLVRTSGVMSASVVERNLVIRVGCFNPTINAINDLDFFLKVARLAEWHTIPQRLGFTRLHDSQMTDRETENNLRLLVLRVSVWYSGHALPHKKLTQHEVQRELRKFGEDYEWYLRHTFWGFLKYSGLAAAMRVSLLGSLLLPDKSRYLRTFIHPTIMHYFWVWRHRKRRSLSARSESAPNEKK